MDRYTLDDFIELEHEFTLNNSNGVLREKSFSIVKGSIPVLLSCPHSVNQMREGKLKEREKYSGALGKTVQRLTGSYLICKTYNDGFDDNYDFHTPYKDAIGRLLKEDGLSLVLDIHGMVSSKEPLFRGYHIELGTDSTKNLLNKTHLRDLALNTFKEFGIKETVADEFFKASKPYTISNYTARVFNTASMQIEISSDYRNPNNSIENFNLLIYAFEKLVKRVLETL